MPNELFTPRTDRNEDASFAFPALTSAQCDRAVELLAAHLLAEETPLAHVMQFNDRDWDNAIEACACEEWRGQLTDAIQSRVCTLLLQAQVANTTQRLGTLRKPPAREHKTPRPAIAIELAACCPQCASVDIHCDSWESREAETGYSDTNEQFLCHACGARGYATDVAYTPMTPELPARRDAQRARVAVANVRRLERAVRVEVGAVKGQVA